MLKDISDLFVQPVLNVWHIFANYLPNIIAALIFILFGLFMARVLSSVAENFLRRVKLDSYTSRVGVNEVLARFGLGKSLVTVIGLVIYWSLILVFFVSAANVLNLTVISAILERFVMDFMPRITAAIFIGFGGLLFAKFLGEVVLNSATANNLRGGRLLSQIVYFTVIVFAAIVALEQMGIEMKVIRSSLNIILGSLGLAFAIAFGLGAKDAAAALIKTAFQDDKK